MPTPNEDLDSQAANYPCAELLRRSRWGLSIRPDLTRIPHSIPRPETPPDGGFGGRWEAKGVPIWVPSPREGALWHPHPVVILALPQSWWHPFGWWPQQDGGEGPKGPQQHPEVGSIPTWPWRVRQKQLHSQGAAGWDSGIPGACPSVWLQDTRPRRLRCSHCCSSGGAGEPEG